MHQKVVEWIKRQSMMRFLGGLIKIWDEDLFQASILTICIQIILKVILSYPISPIIMYIMIFLQAIQMHLKWALFNTSNSIFLFNTVCGNRCVIKKLKQFLAMSGMNHNTNCTAILCWMLSLLQRFERNSKLHLQIAAFDPQNSQ